MIPDSSSPDFARLAAAWLDGTSSPEDAERLWQAVATDPACALEFAALARFDSLLAATVRERAGEKSIVAALEMEAANEPLRQKRSPRPLIAFTPIRLAAVVALLGLCAWLFWSPSPQFSLTKNSSPKPAAGSAASVRVAAGPVMRPALIAAAEASMPDMPLADRLDRFFLTNVDLNQVPLQQALGRLQGQLLELNFLDAQELKQMQIKLPTDASARRITFRSGSISFLKAVRAVAALGGCDLAIDEPSLVLTLHREIFPQLPNKKDVRDVLAGMTSSGGNPASEDPARLAALLADAASLGIPVDSQRPLEDQPVLPVTRGQWMALQALTEARDQLSRYQSPGFQIYFTDRVPKEQNRVIEEGEVNEMRLQFEQKSISPALVLWPEIDAFNTPVVHQDQPAPVLEVHRVGELAHLTVGGASTAFVLRGQGVVLSLDATSIRTGSLGDAFSHLSGTTTGSTSIVILPATSPPPTPP